MSFLLLWVAPYNHETFTNIFSNLIQLYTADYIQLNKCTERNWIILSFFLYLYDSKQGHCDSAATKSQSLILFWSFAISIFWSGLDFSIFKVGFPEAYRRWTRGWRALVSSIMINTLLIPILKWFSFRISFTRASNSNPKRWF